MISTNIDCVDVYFEFLILTNIHGKPTYETLTKVKNELCSNAMSVTSNLVGDAHVHLGTVDTDAEYAVVLPVPYVRPVHPGPIVIPVGTSQYKATRLCHKHFSTCCCHRRQVFERFT